MPFPCPRAPHSRACVPTPCTLPPCRHPGAASIVEVYACMLLGFLVQASPQAQREAAARLPGASLAPLAAAVERCLLFYVTAGKPAKGAQRCVRTG